MKPTIEQITFKQVFNETLVEQLKNGEIDLVNKVASADVMDAAAETEGIASVTYDREGLAFLAFACENEPVSSANVRKAIDDILALEGVVTGGFPSVIRVQD